MSYIIDENKDIVLAGWEEGIFDDPFKGIYDMRNVDIVTIPGEASIAMKTEAMQTQAPLVNVPFTVDAGTSTSIFTFDGVTYPLEVNTAITFTGADLPNGLGAGTIYYIKSAGTGAFFVSEVSAGGTTKTFSDNGTGTMTFSTVQMSIPIYQTMAVTNEFYSGGNLKKLYFTLDDLGRCWVKDSNQLGSSNKWIYMNNRASENLAFTIYNGAGLIAWKNYLFVLTQNAIDVIYLDDLVLGAITLADLTTKTNWHSSWQSTNFSKYHQAIIDSQREAFYFADGSALGVVSEVDGGIFGLSPTATVADGVTTNADKTITTVTGFFTSLMVGCVITGTGIPLGARIASVTNNKSAEITSNATADGSGITFTVTQSYNFSNEAFAGGISADDTITCLTELNAQILMGGTKNYIYPWDKLSQGYGTVLFLSENFTTRMVTINTTAYIFAGHKGRIFMTNGSNVTPFWKIPEYLSNTCNPYIIWTDATFNRNQLYFGLRATTNSGTTINEYGGLWAVNVDTSTPTYPRLQNKLSYNTYSGYVSCLLQNRGDSSTTYTPSADGYGLFIGWYDGTKGGIDKGISTPYTAGESYIILDPLNVGQYKTKRTFSNIEYKLAAPLVIGESVSVSYRTDLSGAFTDVPITSGGQAGDVSGLADAVNFQGSQWVQLKVILNGTATNPSFVRLREVRLR